MSERALILGDDIGTFLAVARSLGRRGIEVHVTCPCPDLPGLASRYIRAVHELPFYFTEPSAWVDALRALIAQHDYRLILPCSDDTLMLLDHHAEAFGRERLALPNPAAFAAFTNKAETRALARRTDVPVAKGMQLRPGVTAAGLAEELGLPLVLKPALPYLVGGYEAKRQAQIVWDEAALERLLAQHSGEGWLAESFFEGEGVGVSVLARKGRIRLAWQHRRIHAASDTGASTARTGEPPDPRLLAHVETLAEATVLNGVGMFEFRRDPATGDHVLLEVNPRFWGSLPLALAAGADFPALLWDMLTDGPSESAPVRRRGIAKRSMTGEFERIVDTIEAASSLPAKAAAAASIMAFAATMPFAARFDSWTADDPEPYWMERRQLAARLSEAIATRLPRLLPNAPKRAGS